MAVTSTQRETTADDPFTSRWSWQSGAIAGFLATVVTAVVIVTGDLQVVQRSVAGLYGFRGVAAVGWVAHFVHGVLFGVVFAAVLSDPGLYGLSQWLWKTVLAGVVYGLVLALVGAGFVMPVWLSVAGVPSPPSVPNVTVPLVGWHLAYGLVLGGAFAVLDRRL